MDTSAWYDSLLKPGWTPAPATIGTIWTVIYPIILVTFGIAIVQVFTGRIPRWVLVPIAINIVANVAFTPIQFGLRNLPLASLDIAIVLATIVWCMWALWPYGWGYVVALVPYLVWVSLATVLQLSITWMNR
jgi:tryptophan-rich sensory protein